MSAHNHETPQDPTPSLEAVTTAYSDILEHNREHTGMDAALRGVLKGVVESPEVIDMDGQDTPIPVDTHDTYEGSVEEGLEEELVEGDMDAELQDIFHNDTFLRTGIRVAPFGEYGANGEGKAVTSTELVPMIENTSLFIEFLGKLEPEDVKDEAAEAFLSDAVANLSKVVDVCFDTDKQEDLSDEERAQLAEAGENALRTFAAIDSEYARLGIDGAAMRERVEDISEELSDFLNYGGGVVPAEISTEHKQHRKNQVKMRVYEGMTNRIHYWGRDLLPEYIEAEAEQYLTPPVEQGFGPADWQKDGGQSKWQEAFDFLQRLEQEERTKSFADEVRQGLITSLESALAEASESDEGVYWSGQLDDLENTRAALNGQPFDEEQLTAYIQ